MQYTENYSLKLPGYGDNADVGDLNDNTTAIDALIHANRQIEAPAFSTTTAYTAGEMCVYENVLYKFTADKAAGNWDSTKVTATNLADEVTDAAQSGGTEVEANPDEAATADLHKLKVENTVYGIPDPTVTKTATGNPIEITDGADAPLEKCVTEIQGSQDLHGYDKPWVGGAGKNKANFPENTSLPMVDPSTIIYHVEDDIQVGQRVIISFFFKNAVYGSNSGAIANIRSKDGTNHYFTPPQFGMTPNTPLTGIYSVVAQSAPNFNDILVYLGTSYAQFSTGEVSVMLQIGSAAQVPTAYEPYSNICPITAYTYGEIEVSDGDGNTTTHTTTYPSAIYRGSDDCVSGTVTTEWGMIASYAGETLPGEWISDRDEYAPGTTPTTGAQVAYALATPTTAPVAVSNAPIKSLSGYSHIESTTGEMEVEYITEGYQPILDLIPEGSGGDLYSTTPMQVGEWIDGSAIMRVALSGSWTINTGNGSSNIDVGSTYAGKRLLKCTILYNNGYDDMAVMIPPYAQVNGSGYLNIIHPTNTAYSDIYAYAIILEYIEPASRSLSKGATDSLKADLSEVKDEVEGILKDGEKAIKIDESEGEEVTEKVEEPVEKTEEPVEEPTEKEENER